MSDAPPTNSNSPVVQAGADANIELAPLATPAPAAAPVNEISNVVSCYPGVVSFVGTWGATMTVSPRCLIVEPLLTPSN